MQHTPGPWREYQDGVHPVIPANANPNDCFAICTGVHGPDAPFNKRLIIAAPDLLASLRNLVGLARMRGAHMNEYGAALADAETAIARATAEHS